MSLGNVPTWVETVDDPLASDGKAARMPGTHYEWAIQFVVNQDMVDAMPGKWRCYAVMRCEADKTTGPAFSYGIYGMHGAEWVENRTAQIETASDGAYRAYDLGLHEVKSGYMFWAAPPGKDKGVKAVYVDCIVLVPEKEQGN